MDYEEAQRKIVDAGWFPTDGEPSLVGQLDLLLSMAYGRRLPEDGAAAMYALADRLRWLADHYERELIRSLRWDDDRKVIRTWAQVAEEVQAQLGSKQAAHQRWGRLTSDTRRTETGDARRGAAKPRDGMPS